MPITDYHKYRVFSDAERTKVAAIISELESRGLHEEVRKYKQFLTAKHAFHTDNRGYFVKKEGKFFNPNEAQKGFIESNARFSAYIGGRGSGKSATGSQKALRKIEKGQNGAVLNPDFENFKTSTWPEFKEWIPWDNVIPAQRYRAEPGWTPLQPFTLTFTNGVNVICKGLKSADSARGPNINWLWYDEAGRDLDGMAWRVAIASVRVGYNPQGWITTTPRGKLHWIYEFFFENEEEMLESFREETGREYIETFHSSITDNMDNLDPGFYASIINAYPPGYLRDQEVHGMFVHPEGALGDRSWFDGKIVPHRIENAKKRIRYWDTAASEKKVSGRKANDPDESVGTLMSWNGEKDFYIEHQECGFWEYENLLEHIKQTAIVDGPSIPIYIEQEPGAGGKNQISAIALWLKENLGAAWRVESHRPEGDKVMRANPWFAEASQGFFYLVQGSWNDPFLDQLDSFPEVPHDDRVDSVSGARAIIAPYITWKNIKFIHI